MTKTNNKFFSKVWALIASVGLIVLSALVLTACGKSDPKYTVPTGLTATYGQTLEDVELTEGFSWEDPLTTSVGNVGNNTFKVTYTPEDTDNYNIITGIDVTITVVPADLSAPTGLTATYGQTLADITLPENWIWAVDTTTSVGIVGEQVFTVSYIGEDAENYANTTNVQITITVTKASNEVTGTVSITGWTYGEEANTPSGVEATFGDVVYKYSTSEDGQYSEVVPTDAGTYYVKAVVVGTENYDGAESEAVEFTIAKADPEYTAPTFEETYDVHTTLSEIIFEDSKFAWKEPATVVAFGENSYTAVYTPEDTANYNTVEVQIAVTGGYVMPEVQADLGETPFSITDASLTNQLGNDVTPEVNVAKLTRGEDYEIIWQYYNEKILEENDRWQTVSTYVGSVAGEYRAEIRGIGNYEGQTKYALFTVTKTEFNGTIEIQGVDFGVVAGEDTVANIGKIENVFFGTLTWDTTDENYSTPLELGINTRYVNITGGTNYNAKEHYPVTIIVAQTVTNNAAFKSAIEEGVTEIYISRSFAVTEEITVPQGTTIRVKKGQTFTVGSTGTLILEGWSIVNEGTINSKANDSRFGDLIVKANTANNVRSAVNSGFVSKIVLNNDINFIENQVWKFTSARTLEIDLNGHNINGSIAITTNDNDAEDPHAAVADKIDITITNSQEEGGKITGKMIGNVNYALFVEGNAEALTVKLNNVIVESAGFALSTNGQYAGATIVATDSTFTSTLNNKVAVYLPADYTVTFTNCQISGATGIYVRNGNVTISNSTVTATGEYVEPVFTQGSAQSIGSAIIVDSAYGYADEITVTITGTTINSTNGYGIHEIATAPEGQEAKDVAIVTQSENTIEATKGETIILQ